MDERDIKSDEEGETTAIAVWTILTEEVVPGEARRAGVTFPKLGFLKAAHPDVVERKEIAKLGRRVFESITIPLDDDEGLRGGARVGMDARHHEKEKEESTAHWLLAKEEEERERVPEGRRTDGHWTSGTAQCPSIKGAKIFVEESC